MPNLTAWGVTEITKLKDDLDRHVEALFEDFGLARGGCSSGGVNLSQTGGEWIITCPMPGFEPEDVAVTVTGLVLSILAVRRQGEGGGLVRLAREVALPFAVEAAEAELSGGVLTVRLIRQAPPVARSVPVAGRRGNHT